MQVRRDYIGALNAVLVSALLGNFFTIAKAEAPNPFRMNDFCRAVAMFDIVDQEWGKALITEAKSRVANEAKKQANEARVLFTKLTNSSFDRFDEGWKRACGYTEVLNSQEILIRSDNPFKDTIFLSHLDEAKSLYRRWEMRVELEQKEALNSAKPEEMKILRAGLYIQAIASPDRGNVEVFWRSRPSLQKFKILELVRSPGSSTPNYALLQGPFGSIEEAQRFMATPGLPRDLWLRDASKIRPLLPDRTRIRQEQIDKLAASLGKDPKAKAADKGEDAQTETGQEGDAARGDRNEVLANYAAALRARVRSRISFDPARAPDNPEVTFIVEQQSTGRIVKVTKKKSSGNLGWDSAVERALWASSPLPKTSDGRVENPITFAFRPYNR